MFPPVQSLTKPLLYLLIAAQLLLAVPAFAASVAVSTARVATQSQPPCHGMPGHSVDDPDKPACCSGDAGSMQVCLASCLLGPAIIVNLSLPVSTATRVDAPPALPTFLASAASPPLKPPPIF